MLSLKMHNILDYVAAVAVIACPWLFNFADMHIARDIFVGAGLFVIVYSLFTNYRFALVHQIPIGAHMMLDLLTGVFLFVAPWVFNYKGALAPGQEYLHYVLGVGLFAFVGFTRVHRETDKAMEDRRHAGLTSRPATSSL